VLTGFANYIN